MVRDSLPILFGYSIFSLVNKFVILSFKPQDKPQSDALGKVPGVTEVMRKKSSQEWDYLCQISQKSIQYLMRCFTSHTPLWGVQEEDL